MSEREREIEREREDNRGKDSKGELDRRCDV